MNWTNLTSVEELDQLIAHSTNIPVLIFKHSTRCSVSLMVKRSLELEWDFSLDKVQPVFLDLLAHRDVSNLISTKLEVYHESPQAILIKNGKAVHHASHDDINAAEIGRFIAQ